MEMVHSHQKIQAIIQEEQIQKQIYIKQDQMEQQGKAQQVMQQEYMT